MKRFFMGLLVVILVVALAFVVLHGRLGLSFRLPQLGSLNEDTPAQLLNGFLRDSEEDDGEAGTVAESFLKALNAGDRALVGRYLSSGTALPAPFAPQTENGKLLFAALASRPQFEPVGSLQRKNNTATLQVRLYTPDPAGLQESLAVALQGELDARLAQASRTEEVLTAELQVRQPILEEMKNSALAGVLSAPLPDAERGVWTLELKRSTDGWKISDCTTLLYQAQGYDTDELAVRLLADAQERLTITRKHYALPLDAREGQTPLPEGFGETTDPAVVQSLLARPEIQSLLAGRELVWNSDIELFPDSVIRYYMDETIVVLVWQEVTAWACGTYSEIILGDGSQLCRKLGGDSFGSETYLTPTQYAEQTRAVLTLGADNYLDPRRENGIFVYEGQVCRFEPKTSDCCFVTDQGELLFITREQFATQEEAQAYVDEHRVRFSLCYGPVVIENGQDVCPESYYWGDIYGQQARSLLGVMGERHYLSCVVNGKAPGYYHLIQIFAAIDAMLEHGCPRAYALEGGSTATAVLGTELVNVVQYGEERQMSDVLFFASALPPEAVE